MNPPVHLLYRLRWLHLPAALLVTLLQRTPALKFVAGLGEHAVRSPAAQLLKSAVTLAALGALQARAGATTFTVNQGTNEIIKVSTITNTAVRNPATGSVGTALTPVAFTYTGTPSPPQYYLVSGQLPSGLNFIPAPVGGTVPSGTPVIAGTPTQGGSFTVQVQGFGLAGNGLPEPISFTISGGAATAPVFTVQPQGQTVAAGSTVTLSATVTGTPTPTLQWRRNGAAITGATNSSFTLTNVQAANAGDYTVVASNSAGDVTSAPATLTVTAGGSGASTSRLVNLSILTGIDSPGDTFTMGYVVGGAGTAGTKTILIRAAGPTLGAAPFSIPGSLGDPKIELFAGSTKTSENDNWGGSSTLSAAFSAVGAFAYVNAASLDAAALAGIGAGDNSVRVSAAGAGTGTVIAELYDSTPFASLTATSPRLVNVSVLKHLGAGLTAGFVVDGTGSKRVLIRAVGPTIGLPPFNVGSVVADPQLTLFSGSTSIGTNDNWGGGAQLVAAFSQVGAFALPAASRDAALLVTLQPGAYTVQVGGVGGTTGVAIVEVYEVP